MKKQFQKNTSDWSNLSGSSPRGGGFRSILRQYRTDHMTVDDIRTTAKDDGEDPPAVYLCQVSARVSCGACCGLYNMAALSRAALVDRLTRRTERFAATPRTEDGIEQFRRAIEGWTPEEKPFPQFHHCPFLGLIGNAHTRVGCLLHPAASGNDGQDFRCVSYYGVKACRSYFCPATRSLPTRYLHILRRVWDDWYAYGLIITEHRLLQAVFTVVEYYIDRPVDPGDFPAHSEATRCLREVVDLKLFWPYRCTDATGPCHFVFENGLYSRPEIKWPSLLRPDGHYQTILRELESCFASDNDMLQAEKILRDLFSRIFAALD